VLQVLRCTRALRFSTRWLTKRLTSVIGARIGSLFLFLLSTKHWWVANKAFN
jgi:hypothetical protein